MKKSLIILFALSLSLIAAAADMVLEAGDYRLVFSEKPELYSIVQVFYQGAELGTRTGYYSNVLAPDNGKYIGAGHTEGGLEKLLSTKLSVDGKPAATANRIYKGQKLVFTKSSMLDKIKINVVYTLTPQYLKIDKSFEATAEQKVYSLYLYQFCWNSSSTNYLFGRRRRDVVTGKFLSDGKMRVYGEPEAFYFSQYFPKMKKGILTYMCGFGSVSGKNLLWDRPNYHKYYFWIDLPKILPAGYKSPTVSMIVKGFNADSLKTWETKVNELCTKLKKQYPFALNPTEIKPLPKNGLIIKGAKKFQCRKFKLPLDPGKEYSICFSIRKTAPMSAKITDHYIVIGYYNAKRQFKTIVNFAAGIKSDNKWHQIKGAFKTPEIAEPIFMYIYNSHSTGTVSVRELTINRQ
jgi:hypothetical protein